MVAINKTVKPDFILFGQDKVSAPAWAQPSKACHPLPAALMATAR